MVTVTAEDPKRWKRKYLESLDVAERHERRLAEVEDLLYRSVSRLALGAYGLDDTLDSRLDKLRAAARERQSAEKIAALAERVQACTPGGRERPTGGRDRPTGESGGPGGEPAGKEAQAPTTPASRPSGWRRLLGGSAANDTAAASVSAELAEALEARLGERIPPGSLGKAIAGRSDADAIGPLAAQLASCWPSAEDRDDISKPMAAAPEPDTSWDRAEVSALLESLESCEPVRDAAATLRVALDDAAPAAVILGLAHIARRLREEMESERAEMRRYLEELDGSLDAMAALLDTQGTSHAEGRDAHANFDDAITREVGALNRAVAEATELSPLQATVSTRLAALQTRVSTFVELETERIQSLEATGQAMHARLAAAEAERTSLEERLDETRRAALRDGLTGCYNRAAFDDRMALELTAQGRHHRPLCLVILDIDHFKQVNDTLGHPAGDQVLEKVGEALRAGIRRTDFLARYGGEEFALLLPDTDLEQCTVIAEKLRARIAQTRFVHRGKPVPITVSGGLAECVLEEGADTFVERADQALYRAKHEGRNRVVAGDGALARSA